MSNFFEDTMHGLLEAIEMERGNIPLVKKNDMPVPTFTADNKEKALINELVELRKQSHITQEKLAQLTGNKQQAISRFEKCENSPSVKSLCSIANALGYDVKLVKQNK